MIVGIYFAGDRNVKLKCIQHDLYNKLLAYLLTYSKDRYFASVRLVGVNTEMTQRVASVKGFDHRVLQDAHDMIAAEYRFSHDPRSQMPLPFDGLSYEEYLIHDWSDFYHKEARRLTDMDEVARAILTAIAYQNTPVGCEAEDRLMKLLRWEYIALAVQYAKIIEHFRLMNGMVKAT